MKTERRHELQTNVLADWLGHKLEVVQPYTKSIAAVLLLLLAAFFAYLIVNSSNASRNGNSWASFLSAFGQRDAKQLDKVAESNPGTAAGLWARQSMADIELSDGTSKMYQDRDAAAEDLDKAAKSYREVAEQSRKHPMLRHRALFGLAQATECLSILTRNESNNQKYLAEAKDSYEKVVHEDPRSAIGRAAARRLEVLGSLTTEPSSGDAADKENWFLWLANQEMPVAPPSGMGDFGDPRGMGNVPRVGSNTMPQFTPVEPLPDRPSLDLPFPLNTADNPTDKPESTEPKPTEPAPAEPKPAEPTPAEPTPAEPTPAEPTPAEPTPAKPKPAEPTPAEPTAAEPKPTEPAPTPAEPTPAEPKPAEPKPAEPTPAEPTPAEPKPAEPKPAEPAPAPAEPTPAEPKPAEPKPAEPKPAEPTPAEPTPAEPKPAEPAPAPAEPTPAEPANEPS